MAAARCSVRSESGNSWIDLPSTSTRPPSMESSPDRQLRSVVFPDPDGPMTATNSPGETVKSTPRSASTSSTPDR